HAFVGLDRPNEVADIRFRRVMQQRAKRKMRRSLLGDEDAVLRHAVVPFAVTVESAGHRQGVRDVHNVDLVRVRLEGGVLLAGEGLHPCSGEPVSHRELSRNEQVSRAAPATTTTVPTIFMNTSGAPQMTPSAPATNAKA